MKLPFCPFGTLSCSRFFCALILLTPQKMESVRNVVCCKGDSTMDSFVARAKFRKLAMAIGYLDMIITSLQVAWVGSCLWISAATPFPDEDYDDDVKRPEEYTRRKEPVFPTEILVSGVRWFLLVVGGSLLLLQFTCATGLVYASGLRVSPQPAAIRAKRWKMISMCVVSWMIVECLIMFLAQEVEWTATFVAIVLRCVMLRLAQPFIVIISSDAIHIIPGSTPVVTGR